MIDVGLTRSFGSEVGAIGEGSRALMAGLHGAPQTALDKGEARSFAEAYFRRFSHLHEPKPRPNEGECHVFSLAAAPLKALRPV